MAIYLVSGKLGSGKTLASVGVIRDALLDGRRVATNLDLTLEKILPARLGRVGGRGSRLPGVRGAGKPVSCVRLPDKPDVADLDLLGCGNEEMDETRNGVIVLDELASWLNARSFNDKSRAPVLDWLIHSRKHGWDVYFICQHIEQIDKQVRTSLVEYLVICRRLDRLKVPFVGKLLNSLSGGLLSGNLPQIHVGIVKYGVDQHSPISDRWVYRGRALYSGYNTRQVFTSDYACGPFSYLSPWHLVGWRQKTFRERLAEWWDRSPVLVKPEPKAKLPLVQILGQLPEPEALRHWRRLDALGAFSPRA